MSLPVALAVVFGSLVLACSTAAPAIPPAEPTPNIDATVEAKLAQAQAQAQAQAVDATVEARLKEERASRATATSMPTPTPAPAPTPFQWPGPPTGQRELMLSSISGSVGDEVTAIGRGFAKIKAYAALWIDSNDNGLIDDGEHVIDWGNIETPRGEFSHTFTIDSNFQGTSSINAQDAGGMRWSGKIEQVAKRESRS